MRENVPNWHQYFMGMAVHASTRSKDPRTRVGAVAIDQDKAIISTGYNGLPYGVPDTLENWEDKDNLVIHAEENLVAHAARHLGGLRRATVYSTHITCLRCARLLTQCNVAAVYYKLDNTNGFKASWIAPQWEHIRKVYMRAGVEFMRVTDGGMLEPSSCWYEAVEP